MISLVFDEEEEPYWLSNTSSLLYARLLNEQQTLNVAANLKYRGASDENWLRICFWLNKADPVRLVFMIGLFSMFYNLRSIIPIFIRFEIENSISIYF